MKRTFGLAAFVGVTIGIVGACTHAPSSAMSECVPGRTITCDDCTDGFKTCDASGRYSACICDGVDAGADAAPDVPKRWSKVLPQRQDGGHAVAVGPGGDIFVGSTGFEYGPTLARLAPSGKVVWAKTPGDIRGVAVDGSGNVYVAGDSPGAIDLGGGPVAAKGGFVAKYDPNGSLQWVHGPFAAVSLSAIGVIAGRVVVAGSFTAETDLGAGKVIPTGTRDALLFELTPFRLLVRQRTFGSEGSSGFDALTLDPNGNLFLSGTFDGAAIAFGGPAILRPNGSTASLFIVELDPTDAFVGQADGRGLQEDRTRSLSVGADGSLWAVGQLGTRVQFGAAALTPIDGQTNVWLARFDSKLKPMWSRRFGSPSPQWANGVAADPAGGAIVVGYDGGELWMGKPGLTGGAWAARFDDAGQLVRNLGFNDGPSNKTVASSVTFAGGKSFVLAGQCFGNLVFPSGKITCNTFGAAFIAKLEL